MDHSHEIEGVDEAILSMKKYWQNPKKYEFTSEIREVNGDLLRLKNNYFYPEGGGQPSDTGQLLSGKETYHVQDVFEEENIVWLKLKKHNLEEGMSVTGKIDQNRRETLSRNHSSQHLLSAVFWEEFELDTQRALIEVSETEIEFDKTPNWKQVEKGLNLANTYIFEEHPILSRFYSDENISDLKLRGGIDGAHDIYRIVEINTIDLNPCGGTHVTNTGEIRAVAIQKLDGKRLKFISGLEAQKMLTNEEVLLHQMSRNLHTSVDMINEETMRLYDQNKELQKQILDLQNQLLIAELSSFPKQQVGEFNVMQGTVSNLNRGVILDQMGELDTNAIRLIKNKDGGFILITGSETLTKKIMSSLRDQGAKGGGRGNVVMGNLTTELNSTKTFIELLHSIS